MESFHLKLCHHQNCSLGKMVQREMKERHQAMELVQKSVVSQKVRLAFQGNQEMRELEKVLVALAYSGAKQIEEVVVVVAVAEQEETDLLARKV